MTGVPGPAGRSARPRARQNVASGAPKHRLRRAKTSPPASSAPRRATFVRAGAILVARLAAKSPVGDLIALGAMSNVSATSGFWLTMPNFCSQAAQAARRPRLSSPMAPSGARKAGSRARSSALTRCGSSPGTSDSRSCALWVGWASVNRSRPGPRAPAPRRGRGQPQRGLGRAHHQLGIRGRAVPVDPEAVKARAGAADRVTPSSLQNAVAAATRPASRSATALKPIVIVLTRRGFPPRAGQHRAEHRGVARHAGDPDRLALQLAADRGTADEATTAASGRSTMAMIPTIGAPRSRAMARSWMSRMAKSIRPASKQLDRVGGGPRERTTCSLMPCLVSK